MKVHEIMSVDILSVNPKAPLKDLWSAIFKNNVHSLPVVDAKNRLVGIVAEQDLLQLLYPNHKEFIEDFASASDFEQMEHKVGELAKLRAEHVMCKRVIFTRADTPIMRALSRMIVRRVNQLPVLSEDNDVIGVVTKGDIFNALFKRHLTKSPAVPSQSAKKKVGRKR